MMNENNPHVSFDGSPLPDFSGFRYANENGATRGQRNTDKVPQIHCHLEREAFE